MFSRFFIDRPIFAAVLSIFLVLAGLSAMRTLPIAQYPEIAPPVVTVTAIYPGASAEVIEQTVAAPLENQINGVEHMLYMNSTSTSNGTVQIQVTFDIGTDIDQAALNVNNRVKQAEPRLPQEVRRQGVTVEKGSSSFLQVLAFFSPDGRYDDLYTSNYVLMNVLDQLKRVPGTTNVQIFGAKDYAMRIWVKPDRLTQLKLTTGDLVQAINEQNAQFAAGKIGQTPTGGPQELVYTITTKGRLADAREFENIIIRANADGATLRLKDVARVELAAKDYDFIGRINGKTRHLSRYFFAARCECHRRGERGTRQDDRAVRTLPRGLHLFHPLRHHALCRSLDPRSADHLDRGDVARVFGRVLVFAKLARHINSLRRRAGVANWHLCRHVHAGLLDQYTHLIRHGAGNRNRGGRRDCGIGKRCRPGLVRTYSATRSGWLAVMW